MQFVDWDRTFRTILERKKKKEAACGGLREVILRRAQDHFSAEQKNEIRHALVPD